MLSHFYRRTDERNVRSHTSIAVLNGARLRSRLWFISLVIAWVIAPMAWAQHEVPEGAVVDEELWFVVELAGSKSGFMQSTTYRVDDRLVTATTLKLDIQRGATNVSVTQSSRFVETLTGEPIEIVAIDQSGRRPVTRTMTFNEDGTRTLVTEQSNRRIERTLDPIEIEWLTPSQLLAYITEQEAAGATEIRAASLDMSMGNEPTVSVMRRAEDQGNGRTEVFGRVVPATRWIASYEAMPGVEMDIYTDASGNVVRTEMDLMGIAMRILLADRDLALLPSDPVEMMVSMFVTPDRPIDRPRTLRRAVFDVRFDEVLAVNPADDGMLGPVTAGAQTVERIDDHVYRFTLDLDAVPDAEALAADPVGPEHLASSLMVGCDDPVIQDLTRDALSDLPEGADEYETAAHLRTFVFDFIDSKNLGTGFATAGEVARTAEGDCTEHGVLLAALLRASEIPSRTVTGLVYVDQFAGGRQIFGYHMWTQAFVRDADFPEGRWVDFDATLPCVVFDAAHLALGVSALSQDAVANDLIRLLPMMGGMDVTVVEPE